MLLEEVASPLLRGPFARAAAAPALILPEIVQGQEKRTNMHWTLCDGVPQPCTLEEFNKFLASDEQKLIYDWQKGSGPSTDKIIDPSRLTYARSIRS